MHLKILCSVIVIAGLYLAASVFDGANAAQRSLDLARQSLGVPPGEMRGRILSAAQNSVNKAWSRPMRWHSGAAEAASWSLFLDAANSNDPNLNASVAAASNAVTMSPVQPASWMRLALLDLSGVPNAYCKASRCLQFSWRAAPLMEANFACDRLRIANLSGDTFEIDDARLEWYAAVRPLPQAMNECLEFLPRQVVFRSVLNRHIYQAASRRLSGH